MATFQPENPKTPPSLNRQARRLEKWDRDHTPSFKRRLAVNQLEYDQKIERQKKVERRVLRATTRRKEREEAQAKGLPVKYSIK